MSSQEVNAPPRSARLNPQTPSFVPSSPGMRGPGAANESLDTWFDNFTQHEATLEAMAAASTEPKFQEELGTIEQWFKVLSEAERTASVYTLLQHSNQTQIRFFIAVLQQMLRAADGPLSAADGQQTNKNPRSLRPPSLNLPMPRSPATPQFSAPASGTLNPGAAPDSAMGEKTKLGQISEEQDVLVKPKLNDENSWANMVNTPMGNMFPKGNPAGAAPPKSANGLDASAANVMNPAGMAMMNGFPNMNMMGVSQEAQLLAMQLVMSGMVQPGVPLPQQLQSLQSPGGKSQSGRKSAGTGASSWRSPTGQGRYPRSALKSPGVKSPAKNGLPSAGLKSASSIGSMGSRVDDEIDPELLKDVPAWLKSLRLHKYTASFEGMTWEQMVVLDDDALEKKGVAALGARRRLLRTFENVRKKMGMEPADAPSTGAALTSFTDAGQMPSLASVAEQATESSAADSA